MRLLNLPVAALILSSFIAQETSAQCGDAACVHSGTALAVVSSGQSELLDTLMSSLLGGSVDLGLVDHQALATSSLRMDTLLGAVQAATSSATPLAATQAELSMSTLFSAAASAATGQGLTAAATALGKLATASATAAPTGTVALADLLTVDTRPEVLAVSQVNLLDLVTASASTFNRENAVSVNTVHVTGSSLGLGSLIDSVDIAARVIEPPTFVCGPTGSQFYSAGIRLRIHADLVDTSVNLSLLGLSGLANVKLSLVSLDLVVDVARGAGTLTAINAVGNSVTVQATPGVASLYIGTLADAAFLDRTTPIDTSTELGYASIAKLDVSAVGGLLTATATVGAKGFAVGGTPAPVPLVITGPFPKTATATTQAGFAGSLVDSLANSLSIQVSAFTGLLSLGGGTVATINTRALSALQLGNGLVSGALDDLTTGLVNPLLSRVGVRLGEMDVTVDKAYPIPAGAACNDSAFCTINDTCSGSGTCGGSARACSDGLTCTTDTCNEATDQCDFTLSGGCLIGGTCYASGTNDPTSSCRSCTPATSTTAFTAKTLGTSCSDGLFCTSSDSCNALGLCTGGLTDCSDSQACTTDLCNELTDTCDHSVTLGCLIGGSCVAQGLLNPLSSCQVCDPLLSLTNWSNRALGAGCNDNLFCTVSDQCNALGVCAGGALSCSDGISCTTDLCNELTDQCVSTAIGGCVINGACYTTGVDDPTNPCHTCNPLASTTSWTNKTTGTACSDGLFCTSGDSCNAGGICSGGARDCADPLTCTTDSCDEGIDSCLHNVSVGCAIAGACIAEGTINPLSSCQVCDRAQSLIAWSTRPSGSSCDDGLFCTTGDACNALGTCAATIRDCSDGLTCTLDTCNEVADRCDHPVSVGCSIAGACYAPGVANPAAPCQICDINVSTLAWTNRAVGVSCDDGLFCTESDACTVLGACVGGARSCTDGIACTQDSCNEAQDRCDSSAPGCVIGGLCRALGSDDPSNPCHVCDTAVSTTAWTNKAPGVTCSDNLFCTTGDACNASGSCAGSPRSCDDTLACTADSCNETADLCVNTVNLGCAIAGSCVTQGATNPLSSCQICDQAQSPIGWSNRAVGAACNDGAYCTLGDVCAAGGVCLGAPRDCNDGLTCTADVCDEAADQCRATLSGCLIDSACRLAGSDDPTNTCRMCDPLRSTTAWSPKTLGASCDDGLFCTTGDACNALGACAAIPNACNDSLSCTSDSCDEIGNVCMHNVSTGCAISGACVAQGTVNTAASCQICDSARSTSGWSNRPSGTVCDDGAFCTTGDQCNTSGACAPGAGSACASDGFTCTQDQCNETNDSCSYPVTAGCLIAGSCRAEGARNPADACQACINTRGTSAWVTDLTGCDSDHDGLFDAYEQRDGQDINTDGDTNVDRFDPDDDNDSLPTATENADPNHDGKPDDARDLDGDRKPDYLDADDDGDGKSTLDEIADGVRWGDDVDHDGTKNWYDTDSDGDGALDAAENEGTGDINFDGKPDYLDPLVVRGDVDKDGIPDDVECDFTAVRCVDTDNDQIDDYLDPDDDGDGVNTFFERPNAHDVDTDGDGHPDHLDADNDGDGLPTREENSDPNGNHDPRDARDLDGDTISDYLDPDDDGDSLTTLREREDAVIYGDDVDHDGNKNWYDTNSDGDPFTDREEAVGDGDADDNGVPDYLELPPVPVDAGQDAGPEDAGMDAAVELDAGFDANLDAGDTGPIDTGADEPEEPDADEVDAGSDFEEDDGVGPPEERDSGRHGGISEEENLGEGSAPDAGRPPVGGAAGGGLCSAAPWRTGSHGLLWMLAVSWVLVNRRRKGGR